MSTPKGDTDLYTCIEYISQFENLMPEIRRVKCFSNMG